MLAQEAPIRLGRKSQAADASALTFDLRPSRRIPVAESLDF